MALTNNFISPTSLVFQPRDFSQQIAQKQADGTRALQNMFKFGTQVYDAYKNRQIADEMAKDEPDYKKIDSLAAQRINSPDTTFSNWRWKQGQELTKEENKLNREAAKEQREEDLERIKLEKDAAKAQALQNLKYKIDAQMKPMSVDMATTDNDIKEWSNTLANLEEQGLSGDVGEEYLNKIWKMQSDLKNAKLPSNVASELTSDFDTMMDSYDKIEAHGGYGKNREKYLNDIDANWEKIKALYAQHGQEVPLATRKKYIEARNKFNKVKTSKKAGVLSKI